ncbi:MAG TPA: SDR family NAD(P)-dependent oxidoreductase [Polyangiales bacterium]
MRKTCVVTGANRGIGFAVARQLASAGHDVVLVCRDAVDGARARDTLVAAGGSARMVHGSLASLRAIRDTARAIEGACPRLHVLIHNAGIWPSQRSLNEDGLEQAFVVNHLAPFLLNRLLEPRLAEQRARVVQVSAGLYVKGAVDLARTPRGDDFSAFKTYANAKLCNLLTLDHFAARWQPLGISVNALHPGVIRTGLGDRGDALGLLLRLVKRLWKTPEEGARPVVRLAVDPALEGVSGRYYELEQERPLQGHARDARLARVVCEQAEQLCGLTPLQSSPHAASEAAAR